MKFVQVFLQQIVGLQGMIYDDCTLWIVHLNSLCYFLSFSAWFFSLFGVQYIIYLFHSEYNEMKCIFLHQNYWIGWSCCASFAIHGAGKKQFSFDCVLNAS